MNLYKVINRFREKQHGNHIYEVGDTYPAEGKKLVKERAEFLTQKHPEYGVAFLEKIAEKEVKTTLEKTSAKTKNKQKSAEKSDE